MGLTTLFTHLKIILLQYFQFSIFSKMSGIQTYPQCSKPRPKSQSLKNNQLQQLVRSIKKIPIPWIPKPYQVDSQRNQRINVRVIRNCGVDYGNVNYMEKFSYFFLEKKTTLEFENAFTVNCFQCVSSDKYNCKSATD